MTIADNTFSGFENPKSNYSKMPHALIEWLPFLKAGELKVVLYILRHTWGYNDKQKTITIDEFVNGRKRKDGTRIDGGLGLSRGTIKSGIASATERGFIEVEEDATDKARIRRTYSLKMLGGQKLAPASGGQKPAIEGQELAPRGSEVDPRTEKETLDRKPKKETLADKPRTEKQIATAALVEVFEDASGIKEAKYTAKKQGGMAVRWWNPLWDIYKICGNSYTDTASLIETTVQQMRTDKLTIAAPQSILKVATSIHGEAQANNTKRKVEVFR